MEHWWSWSSNCPLDSSHLKTAVIKYVYRHRQSWLWQYSEAYSSHAQFKVKLCCFCPVLQRFKLSSCKPHGSHGKGAASQLIYTKSLREEDIFSYLSYKHFWKFFPPMYLVYYLINRCSSFSLTLHIFGQLCARLSVWYIAYIASFSLCWPSKVSKRAKG